MDNEIWMPIPGYEGHYEVSDHGRVKSLKRVIALKGGKSRTVGGRILTGSARASGHIAAWLADGDGGGKLHYVHRLVLGAFVGPCPEGAEACHWDDDPGNNRLDNLRWASRSDNMLDRTRNGVHNNGHKDAAQCGRGHAFDEKNTIAYSDGHRSCRACKNAAGRAHRAALRAKNPLPVRTHCGRGHLLDSPNLRKSQLPRKDCLACQRARAWASRNGQLDRLQDISDEYYARLTV